ncbi:MAG: hypothetical protein A2138_19110 [Deltaproteobacteria bacterium RBG_16_71_12]|nr:MAG: hypothetical protein A2138_19110 [Deltaproteobacteria bacterium RBG_16_71_12]
MVLDIHRMPDLFGLMTAPFVTRSKKVFHTDDPPELARRVVQRMTVQDGAPGGLPPGVIAARTGPGHFNAMSPLAGFDSSFDGVVSDGHGGSWVTEQKTAISPIPFFSNVATVIHDVATNPQEAYFRARKRVVG